MTSSQRTNGLPLILVTTSPALLFAPAAGLPGCGPTVRAPTGVRLARALIARCGQGCRRSPG
jgi:hypothetical protein